MKVWLASLAMVTGLAACSAEQQKIAVDPVNIRLKVHRNYSNVLMI